jgi:hypothetical protein
MTAAAAMVACLQQQVLVNIMGSTLLATAQVLLCSFCQTYIDSGRPCFGSLPCLDYRSGAGACTHQWGTRAAAMYYTPQTSTHQHSLPTW